MELNLNVTLVGQLIFLSMFFFGGLRYYLGKRKTHSPVLMTVIGVLTCLVPPLSIIYVAVLALKNDVAIAE